MSRLVQALGNYLVERRCPNLPLNRGPIELLFLGKMPVNGNVIHFGVGCYLLHGCRAEAIRGKLASRSLQNPKPSVLTRVIRHFLKTGGETFSTSHHTRDSGVLVMDLFEETRAGTD